MKHYEKPTVEILCRLQSVIVMSGNGDLGFIADEFGEEIK